MSVDLAELEQHHDQPDVARTSTGRVLEALGYAWRYYTLPPHAATADGYLHGRGIDVARIQRVAGHTPSEPDQLVSYLGGRGFTTDELVDAGLARRRGSELTDLFSRCLVLPIRDDEQRVIGFVGRSTDAEDNHRKPTYLQSPKTVVHDNRAALYEPDAQPLEVDGQVVIVDGPLNAVAIAAAARAAGFENRFRPVLAPRRALSDRQLDRVLSLHPRAPVIAVDSDAAGKQAAAELAAQMALRGREAVIVTWPEQEDPESWLQANGAEALTAVTRRGCLEPQGDTLRPHHGAAEAAQAIMDRTNGPLDEKVAAALDPAGRMRAAAAARYAYYASEAIAPVVVAAGVGVGVDRRGRLNCVVETVVNYGERFPIAAQRRFVERAAIEIEKRDVASARWAERGISRRLHAGSGRPDLGASGGVSASVQSSL